MQKIKLFAIPAVIFIVSLVCLSTTCLAQDEAPTLKLEIYDGPIYSKSDGMCYYRVEAITTGMPEPDIEFDASDNINPLSPARVEVGVKIGDSYTLTATAGNSAGTSSVSIILKGECGEISPSQEAVEADTGDDEGADTDTDFDGGIDDDSDGDIDDDADESKEAPTITLEIYEGPVPFEGVCYYRVQANVTGIPTPTVTFSKDDSGGSWGTRKAQVNLNDPGDTYTLTATATNSEGSVTDSIDLSWGCDVEEDTGDEGEDPVLEGIEYEEIVINECEPILNLCGYIEKDTDVLTHIVWVGDNASNRQLKGYISFDISDLWGPEVHDARLMLGNITHAIDPTFADNLIVKAFRYGSELDIDDWEIGGVQLKSASTTGLVGVVIIGTGLIDSVQDAINNYGDYYQIKIGLSSATDGDNVADFFNIDLNNSLLVIETNATR